MCPDSYFPWELIRETLIRVPIKSLLRFKCLSRSFNALIASPEFIHSHADRTTSKEDDESNLILLAEWSIETNETFYSLQVDNEAFGEYRTLNPPPYECQFENLKVVASCNGLVCLVDDDCLPTAHNIVLWNPSVNKSVVLPHMKSSMFLDCVALGLGFDSDTKDFKVFRVFQCGNQRGAEVYSLKRRSWKAVAVRGDLSAPSHVYRVHQRFSQCVHNNIVHYFAGCIIKDHPYRKRTIIFKFDPRHDFVDVREIPFMSWGKVEAGFLYNGCLAFLEMYHTSSYLIWVLEECGDMSSWKNKFHFEIQGGIRTVVGLRKNGEILMWTWEKGLISYDPETRNISDMGPRYYTRAVTHVESLVLLDD